MSKVAEATPLLTQNSESFISSTRLIREKAKSRRFLLFGVSTFLVESRAANLKITVPADLALASHLLGKHSLAD